MKTTTFGFLAAVFFFASATALADDRGGRYDTVRGSDGWRLGERVRGGYAIYHRGHRVPGSAIDIADGWVLGAKRESGGYAIYRWNGRNWDQAPGGAVQIGGSYRNPWVVNNRGQRFSWNGYDWEPSFRGDRGNYRNQKPGHYSYERGWTGFSRHHDRKREGRFEHRHDRDQSDRRRTRW